MRVDRGLEGALARGAEVLFLTAPTPGPVPTRLSSPVNTYLAVPTNLEGRLLQLLNVTPFSTSVKASLQTGGGEVVNYIRRRIDPLEAVPPRLINRAASRVVK